MATAMIALASPTAALALLAELQEPLGDVGHDIRVHATCRARTCLQSRRPGTRDPFGAAHPWYVLAEVSLPQPDSDLAGRFEVTLATEIQDGRVIDAVSATSDLQRDAFWRLRETIPEAQRHEGPGLKHDISVDPQRLAQFIDEGGALVARLAPGCAAGRLRAPGRRKPALQSEFRPAGRQLRGTVGSAIQRARYTTSLRATAAASARSTASASSRSAELAALRRSRRPRPDARHQESDRSARHHESR